MIREYFAYHELEEYQRGMWRITRGEERKSYIRAAAILMKDPELFYRFMCRAVAEWPKSCAQNLTVEAMNRIAWLGHAGCCIGVNSPEDCTRAGWYYLTDPEMDAANAAAAKALATWKPSGRQLELAV